MDFFNFYYGLEKTDKRNLRQAIIETCRIQHPTFYSWLSRKVIPFWAKEKIAELTGRAHDELFPEKEAKSIFETEKN